MPSLRKCLLMGLVYMKKVELREDIFQVICFFTYVYDSMYTCLFRRISRHRFRCGCVTGVMFCDKRIYIEQTLYILSNVTFLGEHFNSACLFHWCMFRANIYIHPSWRQEMHDTHFYWCVYSDEGKTFLSSRSILENRQDKRATWLLYKR